MTDRTYRTIVGFALLIFMYFELDAAMYGLLSILFLEGVTNFRLPILLGAFRQHMLKQNYRYVDIGLVENAKYNFEAERVWRIFISLAFFASYYLIGVLWFVPWFMGFTIVGAGLSGVCPVLYVIHWLGFR